MKARTLVAMLCIGLMCFTGFGNTTADLTKNSQADIQNQEISVSVVSIQEVEAIQFNLVENVSEDSNIQTSISYAIFSIKANALLDQFNDEPSETILDVGWSNDRNYFTTTTADTEIDPGGVLLIFYI